MKKIFKLALISFAMLSSLAGCSGSNSNEKTPEIVTNFQINAETGAFSFTGVSEAKTYYVRVFNHSETKEVTKDDGTTETVELSLDEKMPVAARRIRFKSDTTEYSGEVDYSELVPGNNYDAYVYTYVKNDDGDLISSHTDASAFVFKSTFAAPVVNNTNITAEESTEGVKLTFNNDFFTDEYINYAANYLVTTYTGDTKGTSYTLKSTDVQVITTESENSCGQKETTTSSQATLVLTDTKVMLGSSITVQAISTTPAAYYDSAASDKVNLTDLIAAVIPSGDEGGGENPGC